MHFRDEQ